jgi:hypothetical protein
LAGIASLALCQLRTASDLPLHRRVTTTELGSAERLHPRRDVRRVEGSSSMFSVLAR